MKELPTITVEDLLALEPCYWGTRLQELIAFAKTKERWNALEILDCEQYPEMDRLWLVLTDRLLPDPWLHELGCRFAELAMQHSSRYLSQPELCVTVREFLALKRAWMRDEISAQHAKQKYNQAAGNYDIYFLCSHLFQISDETNLGTGRLAAYISQKVASLAAPLDAQISLVRDFIKEELAK